MLILLIKHVNNSEKQFIIEFFMERLQRKKDEFKKKINEFFERNSTKPT